MLKKIKTERRLYPRIERKLPVRIAADGYDFVTFTQNISCTGAYCRINKYVPPFTRIAVKMTLPVVLSGSKKEECAVECKGVVVRSKDEDNGGFDIAIFFNEINDSQRKKISKYIEQFLPKDSSGL